MTNLEDRPLQGAPAPSRSKGATIVRIVLTVVCLLLLAMWIYAFVFATKDAAYKVDDAAWRERAQGICESARLERLELVDTSGGYIENPTPEQAAQRAEIVDRATDILEQQIDDIVAIQPPTERDRSLVSDYEGFWRTLIADRRDYAERLRAYDLSPYSETAVEGGPVTNLLTDFAVVNLMRACVPPDELGAGG